MTGPSRFGATASQGEFQADWDPGLQDNLPERFSIKHHATIKGHAQRYEGEKREDCVRSRHCEACRLLPGCRRLSR